MSAPPERDSEASIARVVPLTRTRAIKGLFDYRLNGVRQTGDVGVGSLVEVPFGGRKVAGVVAELAARSELDDDRLAEIGSVLPLRLPGDLVELAQWIAAEYCSTPARALSMLLPPGAERGAGHRQTLLAMITEAGGRALSEGERLTAAQRAALSVLRDGGELPAAQVGTPLLRRLERRGLVSVRVGTLESVAAAQPVRRAVSSTLARPPALTTEQAAALAPILSALRAGAGSDAPEFLLHGVTGSGKTEVYLRAAEAALVAGRSVIILVPEIALTPQALARFEARLGEVVAVLHSGMSDARRRTQWLRLARGTARVCVGARSAIFAPLPRIGLIVIDEEHESSYKHEGDPRYDARAVAQRRALEHGAVLVAGSATPRPESALHSRTLRLQERVDRRPLPEVEILDMRGQHHPLHPTTRLALADCRRREGRAIVLLNRRGWSNFLSCGACGRVWMCPNCEVALVLHRAGATVACHHCGHSEPIPTRCPDCGSVSVARHGAGTERLESELVTAIGGDGFPVFRLDADSGGADRGATVLERFYDAPAGLLVGTQMIAKGHDFTDVSLGVVIDADQTLRFPDFRAEERTFALVTQLAGRVGRGGASRLPGGSDPSPSNGPGRVLVQTTAPDARAIVLAAGHDSDTFLRGELRRRSLLGYPPFRTLIRVVCAAVEADAAWPAAAAIAAEIRSLVNPSDTDVLGPARLFTLRGRSRSQLVVKAGARGEAIASVGAAVDRIAGSRDHRGVAISVDVDPQ
jgi:primosomal protein N' (replication factor Y)